MTSVLASRSVVPSGVPAELQGRIAHLASGAGRVGDYAEAAAALRSAGFAGEALQVLGAALADHPDFVTDLGLQLEILQTHIALGSTAQALELCRHLEMRHPDNCHAFRFHADILVGQGRLAEAGDVLHLCPVLDDDPAVTDDTIYRAVKLQVYEAARGIPLTFPPPAAGPAVERAVVAMMIRDEDDIILPHLVHHHRLGFRNFVLVLNACADQTGERVAAFAAEHTDATVVTITDPVEAYYQAGKTQAAVEFAIAYFAGLRRPVEWAFILDADEFVSLDAGVTIHELLSGAVSAGQQVIAFHLCDATDADGTEYPPGGDIYAHFPTVVSCGVPVIVKNAVMTAVRPTILMSNQAVRYRGLTSDRILVAAAHGARIIHLPFRSIRQTRSKIVNGGSALAATDLDPDLGAHWREVYAAFLARGEDVVAEALAFYRQETRIAAAADAPFVF